MTQQSTRILFVVNVDWFFVSHRLPIALAAISSGYDVHLATKFTIHRSHLDSLGIITHDLDFDRSYFKISNFYACFNIFLTVQPSLIHLITMQPILIGGILSLFFRNISFVFAISGFGHVFNSHGLISWIRKTIVLILYALSLHFPSKKYVIVQNSRDYSFIASLFINSSQIVFIPGSGVVVKNFTPTPLPPYPPVLVFISRLLFSKGIDEFVKSAALVVEKYPQSKFLIVGTPDFSNPSAVSKSYLDSICKLPYISFLGYRNDIYEILSSAHLLVLPSFYPEGLPKVLCEAAACGRPVVTSSLPGCLDAIEDGITGLAIPPQDSTLLASSLISLLSDFDNLKRMSTASRNRAEELFDINDIVKRHLMIYSSLL